LTFELPAPTPMILLLNVGITRAPAILSAPICWSAISARPDSRRPRFISAIGAIRASWAPGRGAFEPFSTDWHFLLRDRRTVRFRLEIRRVQTFGSSNLPADHAAVSGLPKRYCRKRRAANSHGTPVQGTPRSDEVALQAVLGFSSTNPLVALSATEAFPAPPATGSRRPWPKGAWALCRGLQPHPWPSPLFGRRR